MAKQDINIGVEGNDGTGDSIRESFRKTNENFQELYAVFGVGGQITFTTLSDTPDELIPNTIPLVNDAGPLRVKVAFCVVPLAVVDFHAAKSKVASFFVVIVIVLLGAVTIAPKSTLVADGKLTVKVPASSVSIEEAVVKAGKEIFVTVVV